MSLTRELVDWHQEQRCRKAVEALVQVMERKPRSADIRVLIVNADMGL